MYIRYKTTLRKGACPTQHRRQHGRFLDIQQYYFTTARTAREEHSVSLTPVRHPKRGRGGVGDKCTVRHPVPSQLALRQTLAIRPPPTTWNLLQSRTFTHACHVYGEHAARLSVESYRVHGASTAWAQTKQRTTRVQNDDPPPGNAGSVDRNVKQFPLDRSTAVRSPPHTINKTPYRTKI